MALKQWQQLGTMDRAVMMDFTSWLATAEMIAMQKIDFAQPVQSF